MKIAGVYLGWWILALCQAFIVGAVVFTHLTWHWLLIQAVVLLAVATPGGRREAKRSATKETVA